jgi:hypothetical protein
MFTLISKKQLVVLLRKVLLTLIAVFMSTATTVPAVQNRELYQQGLAALLVFIATLTIQLVVRPYEDETLNLVEATGQVVALLSLYLGLWTFASNEADNFQLFVTMSILIINTAFGIAVVLSMIGKIQYTWKKIMKALKKQWNKRWGTKKSKSKSKSKGSEGGRDVELPTLSVGNPLHGVTIMEDR